MAIVRYMSYNGMEVTLGLKDIREKVIDCLESGRIQHDTDRSGNIDEKNLLVTGQVSVEEVIVLIKKTKGGQFETSKHHLDKTIDVYVFKPSGWYIKCYFIEPDIFFISVHK